MTTLNVNLENKKMELLNFHIEGENIYHSSKFASKQPASYKEYHENKYEKYGVEKPTNGTFSKPHQILTASILKTLGEPVPYRNGDAIDGLSYAKACENTPKFDAEDGIQWLVATYLAKRKGYDIAASGKMRDGKFMKLIDGKIQHFARLRNKQNSSVTYRQFIEYMEENVFAGLDELLKQSEMLQMLETKDVEVNALYSDLLFFSINKSNQRYWIDTKGYMQLIEQLPVFDMTKYRLQDKDVIVLGQQVALQIIKSPFHGYNLYSLSDRKFVGNFDTKFAIEILIQKIIENSEKSYLENSHVPKAYVAPASKYRFIQE